MLPGSKLTERDGYIIQMEFSPIIGGYSIVLSTGKALLMMPPSSKTENSVSTINIGIVTSQTACFISKHTDISRRS